MEASNILLIEKLFYKKIMLYDDLRHCFKAERDFLIRIDLDKLWKISKEKEAVCKNINDARREIISVVDPEKDQQPFNLNRVMDRIPKECKAEFQKLYLRLIKLKSEIDVLRKQNMVFINDSLQFLDEMIVILTGNNRTEGVYNDRSHYKKSSPHILLSREV